MASLRLRAGLLGVSLFAATAVASAATPTAPAATTRKEIGALVVDGIPDLPARIGERLLQYQNSRDANFLDWDPAGKGVLVATRFGQTKQVHFVAAPGADRQQWTFFNDTVGDAVFDPKRPDDGFYFQMDTGGNEFNQIYWYDRKTGKHTLLTDGKSKNENLVIADASGKLAFRSTRRNGTDFDIYVKDGDGEPRMVKEGRGSWSALDWSPDGKKLLLINYISVNESYLHVLDLASGKTTELNPKNGAKKIAYAAEVARFARKGDGVYFASDEDAEFKRLSYVDLKTGKITVLAPTLAWDVQTSALSRDGKQLAYTVNEGGKSALYLAATAAPGKPRRVPLPPGVIGELEFDATGARVAFHMSEATGPYDVYSVDARTLKLTQWTHSEVGGLDRGAFVSPALVELESFDKLKFSSWVYKPRAPAAGKKLPVVINIHGGPEAQMTAQFGAITQYMVNDMGVAVIYPNVRGSSGYGKTFLTLDNGMKRMDSVKDIGALLDWIGKQPDLDASRVAVMGGSYGGFMVLASLIEYGERLRCGIDIVGISHFVTFLQNTEDYRRDLRRAEYGDERDARMKEYLHGISPRTNARRIKVPLFVVQGANDPRVPQSEAEEIVKTVRGVGGKVWYLLAKDEGHGFKKKANNDYLSAAQVFFLEQNLLP